MKSFGYIQPSRLAFGAGRLKEVGSIVSRYGKNVLLVVDPGFRKALPQAVETVQASLKEAGLTVAVFDKVFPNPRLCDVQEGAELARSQKTDVIVGMGGGSAMDSARAIAVAATHPGTAMDYLYFKTQPTEKTLPFVLIPTTSGTGSHMSCCAVITDTEHDFKSALWNQDRLFARAALVDPELMLSLPKGITASTGFDVFTHAFESYINVGASPMGDLMALETIATVVEYLPKILDDPRNIEYRSKLAWADTLAGATIANVGTTLPHAMGQPISGHFPKVSHGQSLAVIYPAFLGYTWDSSVERFARIARIFNPQLNNASDAKAAEALKDEVVAFLKKIDLFCTLDDFGITRQDVEPILKHCMEFPDVNVNPKVPDTDTVRELYLQSFK
jgi:alcohol dehydrogenase class IV